MKKQKLKYYLLLVINVLFSTATRAGEPLSDFTKAKEYYQKQDYENAIKLYEGLIKEGHVSPEVYYNLGNSYFKTGNTARSLINYERASKLAPDDDDISFNIKVASLKVVDKMDPVPEIFYKRWTRSIASVFSTDTWAKIFIANAWILFLFLGLYVIARSPGLKKLSFILTIIFVVSTTCTFLFSQQSYSITFVDRQAIVITPSVYVKSSPDEKGSDQFIIHEGTKMEVLDELGAWIKIRIANGSVGWLKLGEIEVI